MILGSEGERSDRCSSRGPRCTADVQGFERDTRSALAITRAWALVRMIPDGIRSLNMSTNVQYIHGTEKIFRALTCVRRFWSFNTLFVTNAEVVADDGYAGGLVKQ